MALRAFLSSAAGAVGSSNLASGAVTSAKLASGAVDSSALGSGAVTAAKISSGTITATQMDMTGTYNFTGTLQKSSVNVAAYTFGGTRGIESFLGDGSATTFDLQAASPKVVTVFIDGAEQSLTTNYSFSATGGAGGVARVTMTAAPANNAEIDIHTIY